MGIRGSSPGLKQPGHEADPGAKAKNVWSYAFTPTIHLHGIVLN